MGKEEKRILYQLAWGIEPVQTRLPWLPLVPLKAPEPLAEETGKVTNWEGYWETGDILGGITLGKREG